MVFHRSIFNWRKGALLYVHSAIHETSMVQQYSIHLWSIGWGYLCPMYMCILLYVTGIMCSSIPCIYGKWGDIFHKYMCILLYVTHIQCSGIPYIYGHLGRYIFPKYMCILLYVKLNWCSGIPQICGLLQEGGFVYVHSTICETDLVQRYSKDLWSIGGGTSLLCICAFCYMLHIFTVVVFHRSLINWNWGALVYVHFAKCETSNGIVVSYTCMINWKGYICPKFMCVLLYVNVFGVEVFHRSIVNWRKGGLGICAFCYMLNICGVVVFLICVVNWMGSTSVQSVCTFCYMLNIFGVEVFNRFMVNWRRRGHGICAFSFM